MAERKAMTIRLSEEQADLLETVAAVDGLSVSEVVRAAIAEHISVRKGDPEFRESLRERIKRVERLLRS